MRHANLLCVLIFLSVVPVFAGDLKVRTVTHATTTGFPPFLLGHPEETTYVHDSTERVEFFGFVENYEAAPGLPLPHMAIIKHCDTRVSFEVDLDHHEYREIKMPKYPSQKEFEDQVAQLKKEAEKHIKSTTIDTGETKDFYGHTAKHLITTITRKFENGNSEETVDGWYLDLPRAGCAPEYMRRGQLNESSIALVMPLSGPGEGHLYRIRPDNGPWSVPRFSYSGFRPGSQAIKTKTVTRGIARFLGQTKDSEVAFEREVVEFSEMPLDPSLFEVPAGFTKVNQLYKHLKPAKH